MRKRIEQAIRIAFGAGTIVGIICGSIIGFNIGAGNIKLPEQKEPCYGVYCDCIELDIYGHEIPKTKHWHCGVHGHDCEYGN